jgi:hypothetical protein
MNFKKYGVTIFRNEVIRKLVTSSRNPLWPPFAKGGFGGISGEFIHPAK